MRYFTRQEMNELDRRAIEKYKIPALILMENAGRTVAQEVLKMVRTHRNAHFSVRERQTKVYTPEFVAILCGPGNNGGDGLVAARHLFNQQVKVKVIYLARCKRTVGRGEAEINLAIALKMGLPITEVTQLIPGTITRIIKILRNSQIIVDAIFGTGLSRQLSAEMQDLINRTNRLGKPVVAIDVPSGLDCDKGVPLGAAIKATETVTLAAPKIGFLKESAQEYLGALVIADIGIPHFLMK